MAHTINTRGWIPLMVAFLWPLLSTGAADLGEGWFRNLELGRQAMRAKNAPGIVYLYNTRALPCKYMEESTLVDERVRELGADFVRVAVDVTSDAAARERMRIIRVPTVVFLDSTGKEVDRAVGYKDPVDFARYLDRVMQVHRGSLQARTFETMAIDILTPRPGTTPVRLVFRAPQASQVHVVGDFNDWRLDAHPMFAAGQGVWVLDVHLHQGLYEYLFHVDGRDYVVDPRNPMRKPNPYGDFNSALLIGSRIVSPAIEGRSVTFVLYEPRASKIEIAGTFTNWQRVPMYRNRTDPGMWGARLDLPPGLHQYKYIIDDEWLPDPENVFPIKDPDGNINSSFAVR